MEAGCNVHYYASSSSRYIMEQDQLQPGDGGSIAYVDLITYSRIEHPVVASADKGVYDEGQVQGRDRERGRKVHCDIPI